MSYLLHHEFDACFLVSAVAPPKWLAGTGLDLDPSGFISVSASLQSTSHPNIFAAGDVATITSDPRPKAGVYAVRAGPVLAQNIRRFVAGKQPRPWRPQKRALAIIGTSDGRAIGIRGAHADRGIVKSVWSIPDRGRIGALLNGIRSASIDVYITAQGDLV